MSEYHCPKHGVRWWDYSHDASKPDLRCIQCEIARAELAESQLQQVTEERDQFKQAILDFPPIERELEETRDQLRQVKADAERMQVLLNERK